MKSPLTTKAFLLICLILLFTSPFAARDKKSLPATNASFAIVTDPITAEKVRLELAGYMQIIESRGLRPVMLIDIWQQPDSLRLQLQKLYREQRLEGAVFIGDIPVPMIRDAQHLTTAFKMNQSRDWKESSVPSDRFYDDFDLKFDYIKQDSTERLYHYYSLRADSPQQIRCDIYSARIKPPKIPGKDKYQAIGEYLNKVVAFSGETPSVNKLLYFAGHGYNSNCMIARIDEKTALREQFPMLAGPADKIEYIDYTFDNYSKYRLLATLNDKDLGLAILHHHGSEEEQLLNGSPKAGDAGKWIALAQKFFRGKIRSAQDTLKTQQYYLNNYPIPASWTQDAFNPIQRVKDSIDDASLNINIPDLYGYTSNARVIILDACFNGSFHLDDYISGYYIFNPGKTMVVKANSVNTLQDTWTNQLMELLPLGARTGLWAKGQLTLESHLLGDPTFAFHPSPFPEAKKQEDLNYALAFETKNPDFWRPLLKNGPSGLPGLRALAIKRLQEMGAITAKELLSIQALDPSNIVRLQAFFQLTVMAGEELPQGILLGMQDSYELIRRLATLYAAKNGAPQLLPAIAANTVSPNTSARVDFQNGFAAGQFSGANYIAAVKALLSPGDTLWITPAKLRTMERNSQRSDSIDASDYRKLFDAAEPVKSKQFTISSLRNSCNAVYIEDLLRFLSENDNTALRLQLAEALGWYRYSYYKPLITERIHAILPAEKDPAVANELRKTLNRLK